MRYAAARSNLLVPEIREVRAESTDGTGAVGHGHP